MQPTTFRSRPIADIDSQWRAIFKDYWPAYEAWYRLRKRADINPGELARARRQLASSMPEMLPLYAGFLDACGDCPVAAQFLTGYQPPAYLLNCSQAVLLAEEPVLIRNYDLNPDLSENLVTRSDWLGQDIIGTNECLWGLDDGMNKAGLAASVTFGGSNKVGTGFGIPFILRYLLQVCETVRQGVNVLQRVPSHMAYNITLLDRHADFATVMVAPGQAAIVTRERSVTNHQARVTWPEQAAFSRTRERKRWLDELLAGERLDERRLRDAFMAPPLRNTRYRENFGTLYTAVYRPLSETMSYHWPAEQAWRHGFASFEATQVTVKLDRMETRAPVPDDLTIKARSRNRLSGDLRRQLLQSLVYLPTAAVGQPRVLESLIRNLREDERFSWKDYAQQMTHVWQVWTTSSRRSADTGHDPNGFPRMQRTGVVTESVNESSVPPS